MALTFYKVGRARITLYAMRTSTT